MSTWKWRDLERLFVHLLSEEEGLNTSMSCARVLARRTSSESSRSIRTGGLGMPFRVFSEAWWADLQPCLLDVVCFILIFLDL